MAAVLIMGLKAHFSYFLKRLRGGRFKKISGFGFRGLGITPVPAQLDWEW